MGLPDSVRFRRQLGLVHQDRLASARVFIAGSGPHLPYLLQNLALAGFGRGAGEIRLQAGRRLAPGDLAAQFLWRPDDVGLPLGEAAGYALERTAGELTVGEGEQPDGADLVLELEPGALGADPGGVPLVRGALTALGLRYGSGAWSAETPAEALPPRPLLPALASLLGALLAQEAVRRLGLFRDHTVERIALKLEVEIPGLGADEPLDVRFDGHGPGHGLAVTRRDDGGTPRLEVTLPPSLDVTWDLWQRLHLVSRGARRAARERALRYFSPLARLTLATEAPARAGWDRDALPLTDRSLLVAGVGGLGSWVAPLLALSGFQDSRVTLLDRDRVEGHNLNRQVLYRSEDVGQPKATAAAARLAGLDPENRWLARNAALTLESLAGGAGLGDHDLLVSAFDNAYARTLLGMSAGESGRTVVDVGGGGLDGNLNLYRADHDCILCHWNRRRDFEATWAFARDRGTRSCQADDAGSSLVAGALCTTSAVLASAAAAAAIATLAGAEPPSHQVTYLARANELHKCPLQEKTGADGCSHHRHGDHHERHARRFRDEVQLLEALAGSGGRG